MAAAGYAVLALASQIFVAKAPTASTTSSGTY
jgi:hypothetical protein